MKEIALALLIWIGAQTGYQVNVPPPNVVLLTPQAVSNICIDEGTLVPYVAESCYKLHKHTIYLRNDFNLDDAYKVGVLVHELTHVLQLSNGRKYNLSTMDSLEAQANQLEKQYERTATIQAQVQQVARQSLGVVVASGPEPETGLPGDGKHIERPIHATGPPPAGETVSQEMETADVFETKYLQTLARRDELKKELLLAEGKINALNKELTGLKDKNKALEDRVEKLLAQLKIMTGKAQVYPSPTDSKIKDKPAAPKLPMDKSGVARPELGKLFGVNPLGEPVSDRKTAPERMAGNKPIRVYQVNKGDTIWSIARTFQVTERTIKELNHLDTPKLKPGQKLLLPVGPEVTTPGPRIPKTVLIPRY